MNLKAIASALGLKDDADEAAILAAIAASKAKGEAFAATATALGVELGEDLTAVASAATSLKAAAGTGEPDPAKYVPIDTVRELQTGLASANTRLDAQDAATRKRMIDTAVSEGRLAPAIVKHAEKFTEEAALASFLADFPATNLGKPTLDGGAKPGGGDGSLDDTDRAIASMLGNSEADLLASRKGN